MDAEILHRMQFGFNLTFHYLYPPLSIGLSLAIIFFEWMYLKTKETLWANITQFWIRVFALTFALGVASGIPLVFSFGTNWSRYSAFVGDVIGSTLAAEGLFAFTMEAGALGILLFGWNRVSPRAHFLATLSCAFGAHFSGVWITSVNSWMQTPSGYSILQRADGTEYAVVADWWSVVWNPSSVSHLVHVFLGAWLTGAFLIISISSYYLLKKRHIAFSLKSIKIALWIAALATVCQLISADHLSRLIAEKNPVKFAAFEGIYKTEEYSEAYLFGIVDSDKQTVKGVAIPGLLSFMVYRDFKTPVAGLDQAPPEMWPWVPLVFQVYHLMVWMWVLMLVGVIIAFWLLQKERWKSHPRLLKYLILTVIFPQLGNIAGWYSTCIGKQPWTVYQLLKTKDAYSPTVTSGEALFTFILFIIVYLSLFALFCFLLDDKIKHGPTELPEEAPYRDPYKQH